MARLLLWADVPPSGCFGRLRLGCRSDGGFDRCAAATVPSGGTGALGVRAGRDPGLQEGERSGTMIRFWVRTGAVQWFRPRDGCSHFGTVVRCPAFEITKIGTSWNESDPWDPFSRGLGRAGMRDGYLSLFEMGSGQLLLKLHSCAHRRPKETRQIQKLTNGSFSKS